MPRCWLLLFAIAGLTSGCTPTQFSWQDTRTPVRLDATADLDACRSYASSQYTPGVPAGAPYRQSQVNYPDPVPLGKEEENPDRNATGTWHSDREPAPYLNAERENRHDVVVPYTGYPGYLDYHPGYLDALVEKCMADRGWEFRPKQPATP